MTPADRRRRKALVERARRRLPDLPTASLYRVVALLDQALGEGPVEEEVYRELERALGAIPYRSRGSINGQA